MRIGVATKNRESWCSRKILEAFQARNVETLAFNLSEVVARVGFKPFLEAGGCDLSQLGALLVRPIGPGSLDEVIFRVDMLHRLERLGVPVVNPALAIERAADKYYTLTLLEDAGLRVPRTVVTESPREAFKTFPQLGSQVVVKPIFGSRGLGITRTSDGEVAGRIFRHLAYNHFVLYQQEFVEHGSRDIRCLVVGDRVPAAMYRVSSEWKTNVSRGGQPVPFKPEGEVEDLAVRAAKAVGCEVAGVDLMEKENEGLVVHEVNSQPGFRGLQTSSGVDIAGEIADLVLAKAKR
ncbi:RimK family alpha-L-glutamate ligase [Candidatus Hecatella orcuttiae]|jgi:RimK family alpha-L-glutamate ligase|uniref:RimK family alpha-L-glutamate ligase n=1 Tax=Candidatus Hecatella orcuttiae TaxID=1935119 RepID=UPI002867BA3C|nr:RimK family alpha-L-glutamate ligase [Candidatus Hecatella orcuttiae]